MQYPPPLPSKDLRQADDYQRQTSITAVYPAKYALEYLTMGLVGEAGEVANKLKKVFRGDEGTGSMASTSDPLGPTVSRETKDKIIDELGDVLWYVAQLSRVLHTPLSAVMENNLQKLAHRKEAGTLKGDARDGR